MPACTTTNSTGTTSSGTAAAGAAQAGWTQWIFPIAILVIFVVLMIVPQKKRDKKIKEMLAGIKVGDNIKTIGGIYGQVVSVKEDLVTIQTGPENCKIVFTKGAIATVEAADVEAEMK